MKYHFYLESEYEGECDSDYVVDAEPEWVDLHVSDFCKYLYSESDGWEWMKDTRERIVVVDTHGEARYFNFELEFEPTFFISRG